MLAPNADISNSEASIAVVLRTSSAGFTSTSSQLRMCFESATSSMIRCASRIVNPPDTGVPTPGATVGSTLSISNEKMEPIRAVGENRQRLFHARKHAAFIKLPHRVDVNPEALNICALAEIQIARAQKNRALRPHHRPYARKFNHRLRAMPQRNGHRHAVDVAASERSFRSVAIAVSVYPQQPIFLTALLAKTRQPADCSHRNRMIAAQHQRNFILPKRFFNPRRQFGADLRDQRREAQRLGFRAGEFLEFLLRLKSRMSRRDHHIATVMNAITQALQFRIQPRHANSRRPHINATQMRAQVHRHANQANAGRSWRNFRFQVSGSNFVWSTAFRLSPDSLKAVLRTLKLIRLRLPALQNLNARSRRQQLIQHIPAKPAHAESHAHSSISRASSKKCVARNDSIFPSPA